MSAYFSLGIWIIYVGILNGHKFPEDILRCNLNDINVDKCLVKALNIYFHRYGKTGKYNQIQDNNQLIEVERLSKALEGILRVEETGTYNLNDTIGFPYQMTLIGLPSMNIPRVDPIIIQKMVIGSGTGPVDLVQRYSEAHIFGLADTKIDRAHWDKHNNILNFTAHYPELRQEAKYNINGKVMMLAVYGNGDSTLRLKEPTILHEITFKENTKNGKTYLHVEDYSLNIAIKGAHYDFENMYDGDEKLAAIVRTVINDNWDAIFEDVRKEVERNYGLACKSNANGFFDTIPYDDIFLT